MKKRYAVLAISLIAVIVLALGSFAYLSKTGTSRSKVASSNLKVKLLLTEDGKELSQGEIKVMPGESRQIAAGVKNVGKEDAWIRVKIGSLELLELSGRNDEDWKEKDGYWYYSKIVPSGEETSPLFRGVKASEEAGNDDAGKSVDLKIEAQGTQAKHNGGEALEAKGWPEA